MIDLERESPVTLAEAPKLIPAINAAPGMDARKPLHPRTLYNWATRGKRGVVLDTVPLGGILVTTREALTRFFAALSCVRQQRLIDRQDAEGTARRSTRRRSGKEYQAARKRLADQHGV